MLQMTNIFGPSIILQISTSGLIGKNIFEVGFTRKDDLEWNSSANNVIIPGAYNSF